MLTGYANFKALHKILSENSFRNVSECCYNNNVNTNTTFKTVSTEEEEEEEKEDNLEEEEKEEDRITINSNNLKKQFNSYFNNQLNINEFTQNYEFNYNAKKLKDDEEFETRRLIADIQKFIYTYGHEAKLNGIVIARIFHGIASPRFPAEVWGRNRNFWRSHFDFDFDTIIKYATQQLINA